MTIRKTCLYSFDLLKPHFYIVKLGFTGVYIIFLISAQKHRLWVLVREPHRGSSNKCPQSMFWEIWKISEFFYLKIFLCLVVKFSIYLNRRVFVMSSAFHINHRIKAYCLWKIILKIRMLSTTVLFSAWRVKSYYIPYLSIWKPQLLIILVLNFEQVQFTIPCCV